MSGTLTLPLGLESLQTAGPNEPTAVPLPELPLGAVNFDLTNTYRTREGILVNQLPAPVQVQFNVPAEVIPTPAFDVSLLNSRPEADELDLTNTYRTPEGVLVNQLPALPVQKQFQVPVEVIPMPVFNGLVPNPLTGLDTNALAPSNVPEPTTWSYPTEPPNATQLNSLQIPRPEPVRPEVPTTNQTPTYITAEEAIQWFYGDQNVTFETRQRQNTEPPLSLAEHNIQDPATVPNNFVPNSRSVPGNSKETMDLWVKRNGQDRINPRIESPAQPTNGQPNGMEAQQDPIGAQEHPTTALPALGQQNLHELNPVNYTRRAVNGPGGHTRQEIHSPAPVPTSSEPNITGLPAQPVPGNAASRIYVAADHLGPRNRHVLPPVRPTHEVQIPPANAPPYPGLSVPGMFEYDRPMPGDQLMYQIRKLLPGMIRALGETRVVREMTGQTQSLGGTVSEIFRSIPQSWSQAKTEFQSRAAQHQAELVQRFTPQTRLDPPPYPETGTENFSHGPGPVEGANSHTDKSVKAPNQRNVAVGKKRSLDKNKKYWIEEAEKSSKSKNVPANQAKKNKL